MVAIRRKRRRLKDSEENWNPVHLMDNNGTLECARARNGAIHITFTMMPSHRGEGTVFRLIFSQAELAYLLDMAKKEPETS